MLARPALWIRKGRRTRFLDPHSRADGADVSRSPNSVGVRAHAHWRTLGGVESPGADPSGMLPTCRRRRRPGAGSRAPHEPVFNFGSTAPSGSNNLGPAT